MSADSFRKSVSSLPSPSSEVCCFAEASDRGCHLSERHSRVSKRHLMAGFHGNQEDRLWRSILGRIKRVLSAGISRLRIHSKCRLQQQPRKDPQARIRHQRDVWENCIKPCTTLSFPVVLTNALNPNQGISCPLGSPLPCCSTSRILIIT